MRVRNDRRFRRPAALLLCLIVISCLKESFCFTSTANGIYQNTGSKHPRSPTGLFMSDPHPPDGGLLRRFTDPVIDDPGLPLADTLVAQIVAPSLQVFWLSLVHAPLPTWLRPIFDSALWQTRGSLVAPTLIHGAGLACCWVAGSLAAQAYRKEAIDPTVDGYGTVILRIAQAGCFAVALLIVSTQIDLFLEFGRYVQPGESQETDLRLLSAFVEVLNDIIFEASVITSLRLSLAFTTASRSKP
jgi:hypothetical protein